MRYQHYHQVFWLSDRLLACSLPPIVMRFGSDREIPCADQHPRLQRRDRHGFTPCSGMMKCLFFFLLFNPFFSGLSSGVMRNFRNEMRESVIAIEKVWVCGHGEKSGPSGWS